VNILLALFLGLIIGGGFTWIILSYKLKKKFQKLQRENVNSLVAIRVAETERDVLIKQFETFKQREILSSSKPEEVLQKLQNENVKLQIAIGATEIEKANIQVDRDHLYKQIESLKYEKDLSFFKLKEELQNLQNKNVKLQIAIGATESEKDNFQADRDHLYKQIESLKYEDNLSSSRLKEELENLQNKNVGLQIAIGATESKKANLQADRDHLYKQIEFIKHEESLASSKLKEELQNLQNENVGLQIAISSTESEKVNVQADRDRLYKQIESLKYEENLSSSKLKEELQNLQNENMGLQIAIGTAESEKVALQQNQGCLHERFETLKREKNEQIESLGQQHQQIVNGLKEQMASTFSALATDVLKQRSQEFQHQANEDFTRHQKSIEGIVQPVQESLIKLEKEIREIEKERTGSYHTIKAQIDSLIAFEKDLKEETGNLVKALRQPISRGQWGEVILEKVLEISGMVEDKHYTKQAHVNTDDGGIRPDIIVRLPNGRNLVIDAKAVMSAYLDTVLDSHNDFEREKGYKDHANQLRNRINDLSKKEYFAQFQPSPEFVILFLPAESLFSTALQFDKGLLEHAASKNIILATPTTLIALLRTVHYGWNQDEISKNAKEIGQIGNELYDRFIVMIKHFNNIGKSIENAGKAFDQTAASFNSRLLPSFNRLKVKVGKEQDEINEIEQLDIRPKLLQVPSHDTN
jgi:DNA recombination protein RmuC